MVRVGRSMTKEEFLSKDHDFGMKMIDHKRHGVPRVAACVVCDRVDDVLCFQSKSFSYYVCEQCG